MRDMQGRTAAIGDVIVWAASYNGRQYLVHGMIHEINEVVGTIPPGDMVPEIVAAVNNASMQTAARNPRHIRSFRHNHFWILTPPAPPEVKTLIGAPVR